MPVTLEERTALALGALAEVTDPADVGELLGVDEVEPGVVDLRFACRLAAYRDWHWTVSTSDLPDALPTVLEVELLPGEGSLLAPPWVPWAERLADWREQHPDERHPGGAAADEDEDEDDESSDDADLDEDDAIDDVDENDLAVDDDLDELDETELEGAESPEESEQDTGDLDDEDDADEQHDEGDDLDDDDLPPRPGDVDRSL